MALESDLLIDRRRLTRRLLFWRAAAVLALLLAVIVAVRPQMAGSDGPHIARLTVSGLITEDAKLDRAVADLAADSSVSALIVAIDSPGGTVGGGEALHDAIEHVAASKPVVAVMRGTAASAGYMIAVPAARIFARSSTLTGSIGVLLQTAEVSRLLDKIGVTPEMIVSGPLKGQPNPTQPLSPAGREELQSLVDDMFGQFVAIVATGRHMTEEEVRKLADGRAYTGRQALKLGLVDAIGGEPDARAWLTAEKNVPAALPVRDLTTRTLLERVMDRGFGGALKILFSQGLTLDGAWALWQPSQL